MMTISSAFQGLLQHLLQVLPRSPFQGVIVEFAALPWLPWLNWFVPVRAMLVVMTGWLAAISLFYLYSVVARWVKLIGD